MSRDDASRKAILARRAKFVAAAVAGMTIAACKEGGPFVCLKVANPDSGGENTPQVCLSPPIDPDASRPPPADADSSASDASTDAAANADAGTTANAVSTKDAGHVVKPQPTPHPTPHVCLTPLKRKDDKTQF